MESGLQIILDALVSIQRFSPFSYTLDQSIVLEVFQVTVFSIIVDRYSYQLTSYVTYLPSGDILENCEKDFLIEQSLFGDL